MMIYLLELIIAAFLAGAGSVVWLALKKINEIENKGRDLIRIVGELEPLQDGHRRHKAEIAILKHRTLDIENFLSKSGFQPTPFDEDSFL